MKIKKQITTTISVPIIKNTILSLFMNYWVPFEKIKLVEFSTQSATM
jgi:intein-encoded DNA endonuclease-like protein